MGFGDLPESPGKELVVQHDVVGEQVLLAAAVSGWSGDGARLLDRLQPDVFVDERHRALWSALREMRHRRLEFDLATLQRICGSHASAGYLGTLCDARPDLPADLEFHVGNVLWDRQRVTLAQGALPALLEALQKNDSPERTRALAIAVGEVLKGGGSKQWLHDRDEIVREQMLEIRKRIAGEATYPYGIRGLDVDAATGRRRLLPGAAPGQVTVITGATGSGKTTLTANIVLGLARQGRRVLYGAWEMKGGLTLELLTCLSLNWSRSRLTEGARESATEFEDGRPVLESLFTEEELVEFEERMALISERVSFMRNPFRRGRRQFDAKRGKDWDANDRNLDIVHEYIGDSGCDVFVGDLWKRCLKDKSVEAEEDALYRQQAMLEELNVHGILLQQQLVKGPEVRKDHLPCLSAIKGSAAWSEIADTILAPHRPAFWKKMDDSVFQAFILKQRHMKGGQGVEFEWDPDRGLVEGGRTIDYEMAPSDASDIFREPEARVSKRKKW